MPTKIFVGRLIDGTTSEDIGSLFRKFGHVTECDVLQNFGFVVSVTTVITCSFINFVGPIFTTLHILVFCLFVGSPLPYWHKTIRCFVYLSVPFSDSRSLYGSVCVLPPKMHSIEGSTICCQCRHIASSCNICYICLIQSLFLVSWFSDLAVISVSHECILFIFLQQ